MVFARKTLLLFLSLILTFFTRLAPVLRALAASIRPRLPRSPLATKIFNRRARAIRVAHRKRWMLPPARAPGTIALLAIAFLAVSLPAQAQIWAQIHTVNWNDGTHSNTSAGSAGTTTGADDDSGWTDITGNVWSVNSNILIGGNNNGPLVRPTGENQLNARIVVRYGPTSSSSVPNLALELRDQGSNTFYFFQFFGTATGKIKKQVSGSETILANGGAFTYNNTHIYDLDFSVTGTSPTTLTAKITDKGTDGTGNTVAESFSTTDSTAGLQTSGRMGIRSFTTNIQQVYAATTYKQVTLSASPTSINVNTTGNSITLTGTATNWSTTNPTFTLSGGTGASITGQSITNDTTATITVSAGSATGVNLLTITDPSTTATTTLTVSAGPATAVTLSGPSSVTVGVASSNFTVALSPAGGTSSGVNVTPSDSGGGGTFSPTSVALSTGTPSATFTYTAGSTGTKTISVTNDGGLTNPSSLGVTASYAQPTAGTIAQANSTDTTINLTCGAATGGTSPYTYQWYRSTTAAFTPGGGNILSGKTSLTLADSSSLTAGTVYYYKLVVTDANSQTATAKQFAAMLWLAPLKIGFIGDSITAGYLSTTTPDVQMANRLAQLTGNRQITTSNQGIIGYTSTQWLPATTAYINAKAAFATAGVQYVCIMLGTNDSKDSVATSQATYQSNISAIANDLVTAGYIVVLNYPPYSFPGSLSGDLSETSAARILQYYTALDNLVNGKTILKGSRLTFAYFAAHRTEFVDDVHPNATGDTSLGYMWAEDFRRNALKINQVNRYAPTGRRGRN